MKLSVSLPEGDIAVLDQYARSVGLPSRSAALRRAIAMLRLPTLERDYEAAWGEWESSGEAETWDAIVDDGIADVSR